MKGAYTTNNIFIHQNNTTNHINTLQSALSVPSNTRQVWLFVKSLSRSEVSHVPMQLASAANLAAPDYAPYKLLLLQCLCLLSRHLPVLLTSVPSCLTNPCTTDHSSACSVRICGEDKFGQATHCVCLEGQSLLQPILHHVVCTCVLPHAQPAQ